MDPNNFWYLDQKLVLPGLLKTKESSNASFLLEDIKIYQNINIDQVRILCNISICFVAAKYQRKIYRYKTNKKCKSKKDVTCAPPILQGLSKHCQPKPCTTWEIPQIYHTYLFESPPKWKSASKNDPKELGGSYINPLCHPCRSEVWTWMSCPPDHGLLEQ